MNLERLTFKELTSIAQYWRERVKCINLSVDRREFESGIRELTRLNTEIIKRGKQVEEFKAKDMHGKALVIKWYYYAVASVLLLIIGFMVGRI